MKEQMRREIYQTKCMRYLTYLDYSTLESTGRSIEAQLESKEEEMQKLRVELREVKSELAQFSELTDKVQELRH